MKKIILFLVVFFSFNISVFALSRFDVVKKNEVIESDGLEEEITPIRNNKGQFIGIDIVITIPSDYDNNSIIISPSIFEGISHYYKTMPGDDIIINLEIVNNSNYNYIYRDNSFILSTKRLNDTNNYKDTLGVGFDGLNIYDIYSPYRSYNSALKALYNSNYVKGCLSDSQIDIKLKEIGYSGIDELDKYYLEYYNNKYNLDVDNLNDYSFDIIMNIFDGKVDGVREDNSNIIALSYNYFYNKLLSFSFEGDTFDDNNSENYSIGAYMREEVNNNYFNNMKILNNNKLNISNMNLNLNGKYTVNSYMDYNYFGYFSITFDKEILDNVEIEEGLIIPPYTGR